MMEDLVEFINELVEDQIQMKSCIPLTPELKEFYEQLMGRSIDEDPADNQRDGEYGDEGERYEKSVEKFLTPRRRFTRKVVSVIRDNPFDDLSLTFSPLTLLGKVEAHRD